MSVADAGFGGLIAFARVNLKFLLLSLLVDDRQRTTVGSDEFHFNFVEFAVFRAAGGCERNAVLVAEKSGNAAENVGDFAVELWEPRESTGLLRKSTKLILGLQIIHMRAERAARFEKVRPGFTQADAEDGNVTSTKSFHCLIESVLGKGVHTAG